MTDTTDARVLIVDDCELFADACRGIIQDELGFQCDVAYSHSEALALSIRNYGTVISDEVGIGGVNLLQYFRKHSPDTKRVLISANTVTIPSELGASYFTKPAPGQKPTLREELARVLGCSRNNCTSEKKGPCLPGLEVREMRKAQERYRESNQREHEKIQSQQTEDRNHMGGIASDVGTLKGQHDQVISKVGEATGEIKAFRQLGQWAAVVAAVYGTIVVLLLAFK